MHSRLLQRTSVYRICILVHKRGVRTAPAFQPKDRVEPGPGRDEFSGIASPRQLVEYLNDYIVGQERAKKVLAVAVYNHYNRVRANVGYSSSDDPWTESSSHPNDLVPHPLRRRSFPSTTRQQQPLFEKSNVLLIGPTGSGKTLLARTLAKVLDVPFSVSDATSFTQAGYVGDDVDVCVQRLLQAADWDPHRASTGIIYIDEADKLARRVGGGDGMQRDIGGEGVQQSLLRMLEGSIITVSTGAGAGGGRSGLDMDRMRGRAMPGPTQETYQIDTSNVLFILSGAFVGLDKLVKRRIAKGSIGFGASLSNKVEEDTFQPFFTKNGEKADAWTLIEPIDLMAYGYIPEFTSRLPIVSSLSPLTPQDLLRILTEPKNSLIQQYASLFAYSGVEIRFTTPSLKAIAQKAYERGGGARGLRSIMEGLLVDAMYEVPESGVRYALVTEGIVKGEASVQYWSRGEVSEFEKIWEVEEQSQ